MLDGMIEIEKVTNSRLANRKLSRNGHLGNNDRHALEALEKGSHRCLRTLPPLLDFLNR